MLFRLGYAGHDLQSEREQVIYELNQKVVLVKINVSIVFDAAFQVGERSRSHFNELEILFTAQGETADEFILDALKSSVHPRQEIVVTSDKRLAWLARRHSAQTESIEDFFLWLNRSYKNKLKQLRKQKEVTQRKGESSRKIEKQAHPFIPVPKATVEESADYYQHVFEATFQEILKAEQVRKAEKASSKPPVKKPRKKKSLFSDTSSQVHDTLTEMERWLKNFEDRLKNSE